MAFLGHLGDNLLDGKQLPMVAAIIHWTLQHYIGAGDIFTEFHLKDKVVDENVNETIKGFCVSISISSP